MQHSKLSAYWVRLFFFFPVPERREEKLKYKGTSTMPVPKRKYR
jgi:hypothetical protein